MGKGRLEAFTDGVIAIIITIMVLEIKVPPGPDLAALQSSLPIFLAYVLSFVNVGIFWNNHIPGSRSHCTSQTPLRGSCPIGALSRSKNLERA
jgi:hypothetical protein